MVCPFNYFQVRGVPILLFTPFNILSTVARVANPKTNPVELFYHELASI